MNHPRDEITPNTAARMAHALGRILKSDPREETTKVMSIPKVTEETQIRTNFKTLFGVGSVLAVVLIAGTVVYLQHLGALRMLRYHGQCFDVLFDHFKLQAPKREEGPLP